MSVAIYFAAGVIVIASTMIYGWLGISAWMQGRKTLGGVILACPFVLALGLPLLIQVLPVQPDLRQQLLTLHLPLATLVGAPGLAGVAFRLYRRPQT